MANTNSADKTLENLLNVVHFLPWIGENYNTGGIFSKRILVLGESQYCGDDACDRETCENACDCKDFTQNVVKYFLDHEEHERWMNTYTKFERSLLGTYTDEETSKKIWNSIFFYNYLQYNLGGPRQQGEWDGYDKAVVPFYQVLDYLKPEIIIVWGLLPGDGRWVSSDNIEVDGIPFENGYYKLSNGNKARVFPVYHPSAGYDWTWWHKVITTMIEL